MAIPEILAASKFPGEGTMRIALVDVESGAVREFRTVLDDAAVNFDKLINGARWMRVQESDAGEIDSEIEVGAVVNEVIDGQLVQTRTKQSKTVEEVVNAKIERLRMFAANRLEQVPTANHRRVTNNNQAPDAAAMRALALDITTEQHAIYRVMFGHIAALRALTTPAEVRAYDFRVGWPE